MTFCERIIKFFNEFDCRKQPVIVKKDETELDASIHNEAKPVVEEKKPLTIEEADTDGSVEDTIIVEETVEEEVRPASENNLLEFDCDERELIKILEEKEKDDEDEDRHRFSMC